MELLTKELVDEANRKFHYDADYNKAIELFVEAQSRLGKENEDGNDDYYSFMTNSIELSYIAFRLAGCYDKLEDYDTALTYLCFAVALYPLDDISYCETDYFISISNLYAARGRMYEKLNDYEKAEEDYNEARNNGLEDNLYYYYMSILKMNAKEYDDAIKYCLMYVELDIEDDDPLLYITLVDCYCRIEDLNSAKYYYNVTRNKFNNNELMRYGEYWGCFSYLENYSADKRGENICSDNNIREKESSVEFLLGELEKLVGLQGVKNEVYSLINLLKVNKIREERGMQHIPVSMHLVFSGNPGTGKTTVARMIAKLYKSLGLISTGQLVEVDRAKLVAGYVGQTAIQTQNKIKEALGGVLFIDEAYTLSSNKSESDFGQEAIDVLLKAMEDNRNNLVVIVAGYPDLMEKFLNSNPGLRSRFSKFIYFDDYIPDELTIIFEKMCNKAGYCLSESTREYVLDIMTKKYNRRDVNFANAREVRNLFEKAVINQANRLSNENNITNDKLELLTKEDICP